MAQVFGGLAGVVLGLYQGNTELVVGGIGGCVTGAGSIWGRIIAEQPIGRPQ